MNEEDLVGLMKWGEEVIDSLESSLESFVEADMISEDQRYTFLNSLENILYILYPEVRKEDEYEMD